MPPRPLPIAIFGDGGSDRDYTFVDDIVTGTLATLEHFTKGHEIFNIGGTRTTTLLRLVALLEDALGKKTNVEHLPDQMGEVPIIRANVERLHDAVGYAPQVAIEEGIGRYVSWLQSRPL